jgi:hypothetical protein
MSKPGFDRVNRRTHLYLGLALVPWFFIYAISSIPFSHAPYFQARVKASGKPDWIPRFEKPYDALPPADDGLRAFGAQVMRENGLSGAFGVYRQGPDRIDVYVHSFWRSTQVRYLLKERKLVAQDRQFRWNEFLTGMHAKGGFEQESWLHDSWGILIDIVCLAMLIWVASGLIMWWKLRALRAWGALALAAGCASFALFVRLL